MFSKYLIRFKGLFSTKLKTYIKKFRSFNGYENLDKKIDSKTTKYKEKVDELEKIQEFLDKGR